MPTNPTSTVLDSANVAHRQQPVATPEGAAVVPRADKFGALAPWMVAPTRHQLSEEGSYLLATNPTPGTGLIWVAAQTSFVDSGPNFYVANTDPNRSLYLDYLQLVATAIATATVSIQYVIKVDSQQRTFTTNNMLQIVPVNPNGGQQALVSPVIYAQNVNGATVMSNSSPTSRLVGRGTLGGLNIAGTLMLLTFGSTDAGVYAGAADAAGNPGRRGSSAPPVIIPPNGSASIYFYMPSSSASFNPEFELGLWAR